MTRTRADLGVVRPADVEPEPWANGLGVTRVLAARAAWRISLAEIDGRMPFSPFLGADRVLIPLSPSGVTLEIEGIERSVGRFEGAAFRGEDHVIAQTDGERVSVVNFMTRRSSGRIDWSIHRGAGPLPADVEALVVLDGRVLVSGDLLPVGAVVVPGPGVRARAEADAVVAVMRLSGVVWSRR
ncbi:HutD family protein [Microbacterium sp. ZW T5_45]|uniref:HutD family protein n=1 Tax=Microbacterium sp. ZW T5_45 TaxID=3378080 RepID=UPI00385244A3